MVWLTQSAAKLTAVSDSSGAPQLHSEDLRGTPTGTVSYGNRRLSGVQLILGMDCRVVVTETPEVAEAE
ncbi:MAG: hypothetical protein ACI8RZ_001034 [Myxococcota bacterium]